MSIGLGMDDVNSSLKVFMCEAMYIAEANTSVLRGVIHV